MLTASSHARLGWLATLALAWLAMLGHAQARRVRPLFEPTDLELEEPGVTEIDLQFGAIKSQGPARVVIPDFELDLGLLPNLEFDLDGAYAIEGPSKGPFAFDHAAPDSLWPSAKWGFFDTNDGDTGTAFALGLQLGPKLPVAPGAHGLGVESLLLIGTALRRAHAVWNAGAFVDPDPDATPGRPVGLELGVDFDLDLDAADVFSLEAGISGVHFFSHDPHQLLATAGLAWSPLDALELSLLGMVGFLEGSDRYGLLLGVSPKFRLFR